MKKVLCMCIVAIFATIVWAVEPESDWVMFEPSPASNVDQGPTTEFGENFTLDNRGGIGSAEPQGTFVIEVDYTPQPGVVVAGVNYTDNLVFCFSGSGETGGLPGDVASWEVQGSCYKVQIVQNKIYLQYVDPISGDEMIKEVTLGDGIPKNWSTFAAPGEFRIRLSVDHELQRIKLEARKLHAVPDEGMVTLLDYTLPDSEDLPALDYGRVLIYNRNRTAGVDFKAQLANLVLNTQCEILVPAPAPVLGVIKTEDDLFVTEEPGSFFVLPGGD